MALALTTSVGACSTHPSQSPIMSGKTASPQQVASSQRGTGRLSLDIGALLDGRSTAAGRRVLGFGLDPARYNITRARLVLMAPGAAPITLTPTPLALDTSAASTTRPPAVPGRVEYVVPAGRNRVVLVEALDDLGRVLLRMHTAADVGEDGVTRLTLNFQEDALARTLLALMQRQDSLQPPNPSLDGLLAGELISPLRTFLTRITGFDAASNTYPIDRTPPQWVKVDAIAERLINIGLPLLATDPLPDLSLSSYIWFQPSISLGQITEADLQNGNQYSLSVLAPINGSWAFHQDKPFTPVYGTGEEAETIVNQWVSFNAMVPGTYTMVLKRVEPGAPPIETLNYYQLVIRPDGNVQIEDMYPDLPPPPLCGEGQEGPCLPPICGEGVEGPCLPPL